ncbi:secreted protein [Candidatus Omnitrophus magneticus]|uniref:Secreted protein n=1 Tax=Candidatus Omnitrophus magneticus TaxID=1609969 RepID=A0A0F0CVS6_9BACT|nr:secreted protein [Candidatus Omnitrophus magneticus]
MKKILFIAAILFLNMTASYAQDIPLENQLAQIYKNAEDATTKGDIEQSDFWLARYMGLTAIDEKTSRGYPDLIPLFKKREDLKPTAFVSGKYDDSFIEFYARGTCGMWGVPDEGIDKEKREFIVQSFSDDRYFIEITASPRLENWSILKDPAVVAVIPLGKNLVIHSGKLDKGNAVKHFKNMPFDVGESFIHYVWQPEMHDLDGDGIPEFWIRYIKAWADGFSQELAIYKIKDDSELVLLKQFSGEAEGIARRLEGNKVEVGTGFTDKNVGHIGFDQTRLEIWEYKDGKFIKTSERAVPHILWSKDWEKYYF